MRFIATDDKELSLSLIESALKQADPRYAISDRSVRPRETGVVTHGGSPYAQIEINRPKDGLFEEEIEELQEAAKEARGVGRKTVLQALAEAKATLALQVLWQDRDTEQTLSMLDPLWNWLLANRSGLVQADGEGWYKGRELILRVE